MSDSESPLSRAPHRQTRLPSIPVDSCRFDTSPFDHGIGRTAVEDARRGLRELGLIDWLPGGQDPLGRQTNRYYFKFPMQKMRDVARNRYETALERHQAVDNSKYPPYTPPASRGEGPRLAGGDTPSGGGVYPATRGQTENENGAPSKAWLNL